MGFNLLFLCKAKSVVCSDKYPQVSAVKFPEYLGNFILDTFLNLFRNKFDSHSYRHTVRVVSDISLWVKNSCKYDISSRFRIIDLRKLVPLTIFTSGKRSKKKSQYYTFHGTKYVLGLHAVHWNNAQDPA